MVVRLLHEPRTVWRRALVYGPQFMALSLLDLMRRTRKTNAKGSIRLEPRSSPLYVWGDRDTTFPGILMLVAHQST
jgi:hypothetical protein